MNGSPVPRPLLFQPASLVCCCSRLRCHRLCCCGVWMSARVAYVITRLILRLHPCRLEGLAFLPLTSFPHHHHPLIPPSWSCLSLRGLCFYIVLRFLFVISLIKNSSPSHTRTSLLATLFMIFFLSWALWKTWKHWASHYACALGKETVVAGVFVESSSALFFYAN